MLKVFRRNFKNKRKNFFKKFSRKFSKNFSRKFSKKFSRKFSKKFSRKFSKSRFKKPVRFPNYFFRKVIRPGISRLHGKAYSSRGRWIKLEKIFANKLYRKYGAFRQFPPSFRRSRTTRSLSLRPWAKFPAHMFFSKSNIYSLIKKREIRKNKRFWKPSGKWEWRYLNRLPFNKNLLRFYNRSVQLPVSRLRFFYLFDLFVFWIYFFYKKIERFIFYFFFELWCNIYFTLSFSSPLLFGLGLVSKTIYKSFFFKSYYNYFLFPTSSFVTSLRNAFLQWKLAFFVSFSFNSIFKLLCFGWNKHKDKLYLQNFSAWRWRRKYKRSGKLTKPLFGRKKRISKTTRFFLSKKTLRWKFRRQHGRRRLKNYYLRVQLRRLKPRKIRRRTPKLKKASPRRRQIWGLIKIPLGKKIIKGSRFFPVFSALKRRFLKAQRKELINKFIRKKQVILSKPLAPKKRKQIKAHLAMLKSLRRNVLPFQDFRVFSFLHTYFRQRGVLKFRFKRPLKSIFLKQKKINFLKKNLRLKRATFFKHKRLTSLSRKNKNSHPSRLFAYKHEKNPKPFSVLRHIAKFIRWKLKKNLPLRKLRNKRSKRRARSRLNKYGRLKKSLVLKRRRQRRQVIRCSSLAFIYKQLLLKKIKFRHFKHLKRRAKNRRRLAIINRRKLLLSTSFRKLTWRTRKNPLFLLRLSKRRYLT